MLTTIKVKGTSSCRVSYKGRGLEFPRHPRNLEIEYYYYCFVTVLINPIVHFWLHHTAHCAEKIVSAHLCAGSASAERVGQGEVGGVTHRVLCTW